MSLKYRSLLYIGTLIVPFFIGCSTEIDSPQLADSQLPLPMGLRTANLPEGEITGILTVGAKEYPMQIGDDTATVTIDNVPKGLQELTVEFAFNSSNYANLTLGRADKSIEIKTGENALRFSSSDYIQPDDDGDGFTNLVELKSGANPIIPKAWTHPVDENDSISPNLQTASYPTVAMDNNGNAIIVWNQLNGVNFQVYKSEYRRGAWTHPVGLNDNISPDFQDAYGARVAMDNNGNAVIVWHQFDGSNFQIYKSEFRNGQWFHPASLDDHISPVGTRANGAYVAMDDNGNTIIV